MTPELSSADARVLLDRWDRQQEAYIDRREERFDIMLEVVASVGARRVLDLCCGPGSLSQRALSRFPGIEVIAVDFDPVLLLLGQRALTHLEERMTWIEADLRDSSWVSAIDEPVDAVLTTTALHWLMPSTLVKLYSNLGKILPPGGLFLNGDHLPERPGQPVSRQILRQAAEQHERKSLEDENRESWEEWWQHIRDYPALERLVTLRQERLGRNEPLEEVPVSFHEAALLQAGFRETTRLWQRFDSCVLLAVK